MSNDPTPPVTGIVQGQIGAIHAKDLRNVGKALANGRAQAIYAPQFETPPGPAGELEPMRVTQFTRDRAYEVARTMIGSGSAGDDAAVWAELCALAGCYIGGAKLAAAETTARKVIAMQLQMDLTPLSADLLTLAYAYVSRCNETA